MDSSTNSPALTTDRVAKTAMESTIDLDISEGISSRVVFDASLEDLRGLI